MKRNTKILLIAVTVLVCLICLSNAVYIIIQGGGMAGLYGVNMERAQWNQEVLGLQRFIFWGWLTAGLVFDALLAVFMIHYRQCRPAPASDTPGILPHLRNRRESQ